MLFDSEADPIPCLPHIESLAGSAPDSIYCILGVRCQDLSKVCAGSTEWVTNVGEADETNLGDPRRRPVWCFFVEIGAN